MAVPSTLDNRRPLAAACNHQPAREPDTGNCCLRPPAGASVCLRSQLSLHLTIRDSKCLQSQPTLELPGQNSVGGHHVYRGEQLHHACAAWPHTLVPGLVGVLASGARSSPADVAGVPHHRLKLHVVYHLQGHKRQWQVGSVRASEAEPLELGAQVQTVFCHAFQMQGDPACQVLFDNWSQVTNNALVAMYVLPSGHCTMKCPNGTVSFVAPCKRVAESSASSDLAQLLQRTLALHIHLSAPNTEQRHTFRAHDQWHFVDLSFQNMPPIRMGCSNLLYAAMLHSG